MYDMRACVFARVLIENMGASSTETAQRKPQHEQQWYRELASRCERNRYATLANIHSFGLTMQETHCLENTLLLWRGIGMDQLASVCCCHTTPTFTESDSNQSQASAFMELESAPCDNSFKAQQQFRTPPRQSHSVSRNSNRRGSNGYSQYQQ